MKAKLEWCQEMRAKSPPEPTVPSTIAEEKQINPFVRVGEPSVQEHAKVTSGSAVETMAAVRKEKDSFKG